MWEDGVNEMVISPTKLCRRRARDIPPNRALGADVHTARIRSMIEYSCKLVWTELGGLKADNILGFGDSMHAVSFCCSSSVTQ